MRALSLLLRLLAAGIFAVALLTFALPFVSLEAEGRRGAATGLELAFGEPEGEGRYADPALVGEIERRLEQSQLPAFLALVAAGGGLVAVLLPGRAGPGVSLLAAVGALGGLAAILVVTASPNIPVATDRRYGLWYAGIALAAAAIAAALTVVATRPGRLDGR